MINEILLTDGEIQDELNKCVQCCNPVVSSLRPGQQVLRLEICNSCLGSAKLHIPIPPQCLGVGVRPASVLEYLITHSAARERAEFRFNTAVVDAEYDARHP
jgi:hypothetical protein